MRTTKFYLFIIPCVYFLVSCCHTKYCEGFNENYAMFIPTNTALNDLMIFYSNYEDSVCFYLDSKTISEPTEHSSCYDTGCLATLNVWFVSEDKTHRLFYNLSYPKNNVNKIDIGVSYHNTENVYTYFAYKPKNNPVTASIAIEDSILVNDIYYKDVVILTANDIFDKVYVAKDMGVIMATVKDSDVVWTINKPVK